MLFKFPHVGSTCHLDYFVWGQNVLQPSSLYSSFNLQKVFHKKKTPHQVVTAGESKLKMLNISNNWLAEVNTLNYYS